MLQLTDLRKSFGSVRAVDGLSLSIHTGEVFGLLGPNGAGKSTTISMAMGLMRPDSGTVELEGRGSLVLTPNQVHFQVEKFWFTGTSFL